MTKLDYSSLDAPLTQTDIEASKAYISGNTALRIPKYVYVIIGIIVAVVIGFSLLPMIAGIMAGDPEALTITFIMFIFIFLFGSMLIVAIKRNERRNAKLYRFAMQNGIKPLFDKMAPNYHGMIFDEGHSRKILHGLVLADATELGNYQYVTGSGKNQSTHDYGYVKIKLTRKLPHMVLDGKANNFLGFTGMSDSFDRSQKLSLEGDFDKYFTLYAPKEYERDALYVFTPDVMAALIKDGHKYDMEIVDDELFIYSNTKFNLISGAQLSSLVNIITTIGSEIRAQTKRYADEKINDRQQNAVAEQGRRLNKGVSLAVIVVLVIIGINLISPIIGSGMSAEAKSMLYFAGGAIVWIAVGVYIVRKLMVR